MKKRSVLLFALPLLAACASVFQPGVSREELEKGGYLKYALMEYEANGSTYVWVPTWNEKPLKRACFGGAISDAEASPDPDGPKSMLEFKDGRLVQVHDLGTDRRQWVAAIPRDAEGAEPMTKAIVERRVEVGLPAEVVLLNYGLPNRGPGKNPATYLTREEMRTARKFYYAAGPEGKPITVVLDAEGKVAEIREGPELNPKWRAFPRPVRPAYPW
jgi:hypothetical protein